MRTYGVREILTDNGKVFTGRFGPGTGRCCSIRICQENSIKHPHRTSVADDDGEGGALAQDPAP
ncbi:MAG: hypothetical protein R2715_02560 [Ilumatobacteraceae bacterium]